jgi:very-short-patch-repair endonuclease
MKGGSTVTALAIEVDGEVHANQRENDAGREAVLATAGMPILRIPNASIEHDQSGVLETIRAAARKEPSPRPTGPSRTPGR